jgi:hypothetical protein
MSEGGKITSLPSQFSAQEFATLAHEVAHLCGGSLCGAAFSRPFGSGVSAYDGDIVVVN